MTLQTADLRGQTPIDEWAVRSQFWLSEYEAGLSKRKRRDRNQHPLILVGNGLLIRVRLPGVCLFQRIVGVTAPDYRRRRLRLNHIGCDRLA
jgi:hypothetical protein